MRRKTLVATKPTIADAPPNNLGFQSWCHASQVRALPGYTDAPASLRHAAVSAVWAGIKRAKGTAQTAKCAQLTERRANREAATRQELPDLARKRAELQDNPFDPRTEVSADAKHIVKHVWMLFVLWPLIIGVLWRRALCEVYTLKRPFHRILPIAHRFVRTPSPAMGLILERSFYYECYREIGSTTAK